MTALAFSARVMLCARSLIQPGFAFPPKVSKDLLLGGLIVYIPAFYDFYLR